MNKQEALEALLLKMREWEMPGAEVPRETPQSVYQKMKEAMAQFGEYRGVGGEDDDMLATIGAAALFLLRDEWPVADATDAKGPVVLNGAMNAPGGITTYFDGPEPTPQTVVYLRPEELRAMRERARGRRA